MKDMRIIESGSHGDLVDTSPVYAQLMADFAGLRVEKEVVAVAAKEATGTGQVCSMWIH